MVTLKPENRRSSIVAGAAGACMALLAGAVFLSSPAYSQQPAQAPVGQKPEDAAEQSGSWVKLCEEQTLKQEKGEKKVNVCLTHHERFHPTTGQPLISAAIRQIDGEKQDLVMVMVPLGRLLDPGLVLIFDEEKPIPFRYSYCTALGCVAESPLTPELLEQFKKGKELKIGTEDVTRKRVGFKVPLGGFSRAFGGPPIDRKVYAQARKEMFEVIRARQMEIIKRAKADAENKKVEQGGATPAPKKVQ